MRFYMLPMELTSEHRKAIPIFSLLLAILIPATSDIRRRLTIHPDAHLRSCLEQSQDSGESGVILPPKYREAGLDHEESARI